MNRLSLSIPKATTLLALAFGAGACTRSPLHDMGQSSDELAADPARSVPVAELVSDFAGVWQGRAEDPLALLQGASEDPPEYRFPSGSSSIRLELFEIEAHPFLDGTLTFGNGAAPAPATDAERGYPIDPGFTALRATREIDSSARPPWEGFPYRVRPEHSPREFAAAGIAAPAAEFDALNEGRAFDGKLDLGFESNQLYESWCALQTAESCQVAPQYGMNVDDDTCSMGYEPTPIDCQKMALCASEVCECYGDECTSSPAPYSLLTLRLSETGLVGVFSNAVVLNERGFQQPLGLVRFQREEETR